jgi:phospholipase C
VNLLRLFAGCLAVSALELAFAPAQAQSLWTRTDPQPAAPANAASNVSPDTRSLYKLKHLIFILQENRSFDNFFGTYPGALGIPSPLPCLPSIDFPSQCFKPYLNHDAQNYGGPYENEY